jgi:hypothetical protein
MDHHKHTKDVNKCQVKNSKDKKTIRCEYPGEHKKSFRPEYIERGV